MFRGISTGGAIRSLPPFWENNVSAFDTRPAFAFLGGKSPKELFAALLTPCCIIDEGALMYICALTLNALPQKGHAMYDPCAVGSRLGVTREQRDQHMTDELLGFLDGLHFHTLCEQNADALESTLSATEEKFGDVLPKMKWFNMGGGHHITRADHDIEGLERCIRYAQKKWGVQVYLEPGEAVELNAGYLAARVLDIVENNGVKTVILDASAVCHMPDAIEMPYTPNSRRNYS